MEARGGGGITLQSADFDNEESSGVAAEAVAPIFTLIFANEIAALEKTPTPTIRSRRLSRPCKQPCLHLHVH